MARNIKAQERALEQFRHDIEGKGSNFAQRVVGYVCDSLGIERVRERSKTGHRGIVNARALGLSKHKPGKRKKKAKKAVRPWLRKPIEFQLVHGGNYYTPLRPSHVSALPSMSGIDGERNGERNV